MSEHTPSDPRRRRPPPPVRRPGARRAAAGGRSPRRRLALAGLLGGLLLALLPGVAVAGQYLERAVSGLRQNPPLYVDGDASSVLKRETVRRLEGELGGVGVPMYVAVLPDAAVQEAGGNPNQLLARIRQGVNEEGVFTLVTGDHFRAGATSRSGFRSGVVPGLATQAANHNPGDEDAAVLEFVQRVRTAVAQGQASGETAPAANEEGSRGGVGAGTILLALLVAGGVGGGLLVMRANRRRREQERRELEQVKRTAQEDLIALADDVRGIDIDVRMPGANPEAASQHAAAVAAYERAASALDRATRPEDLAQVSAALEEGRYAMASAKALLEGRPPPERRPPCFFDPRHGPSVRDVSWAPPGGQPRLVPACAADALRVEEGREPESRQVQVGDRYEPFYNAPGYYAPWYGGYFGGFGGGGLLTGLLLGSVLGGGLGGWGWGGYGAGYDAGYQAGEDQGGDGDFGGGDFGGGDF